MTTPNDTADLMVWFDCETTGLAPVADQILEFCCLITNPSLSVVARPYHGLVLGRTWREFESGLRMSPWCWNTHTANGLLEDLQRAHDDRAAAEKDVDLGGVTLDAYCFAEMRRVIVDGVFHPSEDPFSLGADIYLHERGLVFYIQEVLREHDVVRAHHVLGIEGAPLVKPPMAGSTVSFDRGFLAVHAPTVLDQVHYRSVDVSSEREVVRRLWPELAMGLPPKNESHRATPDIVSSLDTLRYIANGLVVRSP